MTADPCSRQMLCLLARLCRCCQPVADAHGAVPRRWQDAAERDARSKEAATEERQAAVQADLAAARSAQAASRVQARAAQVRRDGSETAALQRLCRACFIHGAALQGRCMSPAAL